MALSVGRAVPARLADAVVTDRAGDTARLGDAWKDGPALLVFLRHFACLTCHEHVTMLMPRVPELRTLGLTVVFVGNGEPRYIDAFIERTGVLPELVEVVTDPSLRAFEAAGMLHGFWTAFGFRAVLNVVKAFLMGFRQKAIEGDNLQQGGMVVVDGEGKVVFEHADRVTGDHADTGDVLHAAMKTAALQGRDVGLV